MNRPGTMRIIASKLHVSQRGFLDQSRSDDIRKALQRAVMCWHDETVHFLLCVVTGFPNVQKEDRVALQQALHEALADSLCEDSCRDRSPRERRFAAGAEICKYSIWCALDPLHSTGHCEIARHLGLLLLEHGADIAIADKENRTLLSAASGDIKNDCMFVKPLLVAGADVE